MSASAAQGGHNNLHISIYHDIWDRRGFRAIPSHLGLAVSLNQSGRCMNRLRSNFETRTFQRARFCGVDAYVNLCIVSREHARPSCTAPSCILPVMNGTTSRELSSRTRRWSGVDSIHCTARIRIRVPRCIPYRTRAQDSLGLFNLYSCTYFHVYSLSFVNVVVSVRGHSCCLFALSDVPFPSVHFCDTSRHILGMPARHTHLFHVE